MTAQYAALGIVDEEGRITQFITSGITQEQREAIGDLPRGRGLLGLSGTFAVGSAPGAGTRIIVTIPAARDR